ncbi:hypothetical protein DL764_000940 [Monosporascus ibericus]|uniref:D-lactate dehydratase n=1 Tax=Monosporascus ibericus TaxID=155417 RepID=A0A4Q4TRP6_9PEZI|nr:hypothetical protein DL764_000940 [Monosporascus ibericus]
MAPKVLVVLTSYGYIESAKQPTGWYLPELAHPYDVLTSKGVEVTVASPKGGVAPLDPGSVEPYKEDASASGFYETKKHVWENTTPLSRFLGGAASEFDAVLYPGGVGPMFDLATDAQSQALIAEFVAAGKPVAAVCHGPVALTGVKLKDGTSLVAGKRVTSISNAEDDSLGIRDHLPFMLEDRLRELGAVYEKAPDLWGEKVVVEDGGKLITGQNPASGKGVGEALVKALGL